MKTPAQATDLVRARLEKRWHLAAAGLDGDDWPFHIALGEPSRAALETDFPAARRWALEWTDWAESQGLRLEWRTRIVLGTKQQLPARLTVPDAYIAARITGQGWPARLEAALRRLTVLRASFPDADHAAVVRAAGLLSETDFVLLLEAGRWFSANSAVGLTPRQVPLPGFHGKWLNNHHALIRALSGVDDLGLTRRPTRVHFTYLDASHLARGGRKHESITIDDRAEPAYEPETIIILENKDTAVYFPAVRSGIAIEGEGTKAPGTLFRLPWISRCPRTAYWGDIDAAGFAIVNDLRIAGIQAETILMDYATYEEYEPYGAWTDEKGKPVPCSPRRQLPALTPSERDLYQLITDPAWTRVRRIEQERIPLGVGARRLYALVAK